MSIYQNTKTTKDCSFVVFVAVVIVMDRATHLSGTAHPQVSNLAHNRFQIPKLLGSGIAVGVINRYKTILVTGHDDEVSGGCKITGANYTDNWIADFQITDDPVFVQRNLIDIQSQFNAALGDQRPGIAISSTLYPFSLENSATYWGV